MSAHRYWRIRMTTTAANNFAFSELQFRTTAGVARPFSGGTISVSGSYDSTNNPPSNSTDGNINTWWASPTGFPPAETWWAYDYGAGNAIDVVEIMITARNDVAYTQGPTAFYPEWSDDGLAWTRMLQRTATWASAGQTQLFDVVFDPYSNAGGFGNRTALIAVTTTASMVNGVISSLVDGSQLINSINSSYWNSGQTGREVKFDFFGFGAPRRVVEATWYQDVSAVHGNWKWQGSTDGVAWIDIGAEFTLGTPATQVITTLAGNTNFYRFYRMLQTAGSTSNSPWLREIEFSINDSVDYPHNALMTQMAMEEWGVNIPQGLMTQVALEQWASVGGAGFFSARHV